MEILVQEIIEIQKMVGIKELKLRNIIYLVNNNVLKIKYKN